MKEIETGPVHIPVPDEPVPKWDRKKPEPTGPVKEVRPGPGERKKGK